MQTQPDMCRRLPAIALAVVPVAIACGDTVSGGDAGRVWPLDAHDAAADARDAADTSDPDDPIQPGATRVADGLGPTCALALDGEALLGVTVGTTTEDARLWRLDADEPTELAAVSPSDAFASSPCLLVVGAGAAWWQAPFASGLWRTDLDTGETRPAHATSVSGVAIGAGHAWWTVHNEGAVYRASLTGEGATRFADIPTPTGIAANADTVWVMNRLDSTLLLVDPNTATTDFFATWLGDNTMTLALGPRDLVWPSHSSNLLHAISIEGGEVRTIGEATSGPIAVTTEYAYTAPGAWDFAREIRRVALDGTAEEVVATVGEECAVGLAADEEGVWWTDCGGVVWRGW